MSDEEMIEKHWPELAALTRHLEKLTSTPYQVPVGGVGGGGNHIVINAVTNANARDIGDELAWVMRTSGR